MSGASERTSEWPNTSVCILDYSGSQRTFSRKRGRADVSAGGRTRQLQESDVVLELLRTVELRVDVDGGDRDVLLATVGRVQMPFAHADLNDDG